MCNNEDETCFNGRVQRWPNLSIIKDDYVLLEKKNAHACLIMLELHQTFHQTTSKSKLQTWPGDSRKQKQKKASLRFTCRTQHHIGLVLLWLCTKGFSSGHFSSIIIKQHFVKPVIIILSAMSQPVLLWQKRFTLLTGKIASLELLIVSFDVVKILGF